MIKNFKIFEKFWTESEIKPTKLIEKLIEIFKHFGYLTKYINSDEKVTYFEIDKTVYFYIKGGLGSKTLVYNIVRENEFTNFLPEYFATISGLRLDFYAKGSHFLEMYIEDIDKVMKQISIEDIEKKLLEIKYNI